MVGNPAKPVFFVKSNKILALFFQPLERGLEVGWRQATAEDEGRLAEGLIVEGIVSDEDARFIVRDAPVAGDA